MPPLRRRDNISHVLRLHQVALRVAAQDAFGLGWALVGGPQRFSLKRTTVRTEYTARGTRSSLLSVIAVRSEERAGRSSPIVLRSSATIPKSPSGIEYPMDEKGQYHGRGGGTGHRSTWTYIEGVTSLRPPGCTKRRAPNRNIGTTYYVLLTWYGSLRGLVAPMATSCKPFLRRRLKTLRRRWPCTNRLRTRTWSFPSWSARAGPSVYGRDNIDFFNPPRSSPWTGAVSALPTMAPCFFGSFNSP